MTEAAVAALAEVEASKTPAVMAVLAGELAGIRERLALAAALVEAEAEAVQTAAMAGTAEGELPATVEAGAEALKAKTAPHHPSWLQQPRSQ